MGGSFPTLLLSYALSHEARERRVLVVSSAIDNKKKIKINMKSRKETAVGL